MKLENGAIEQFTLVELMA